MKRTPTDLARPHVPALHPYVPGTQPTGEGWIKLNTNELPYPPSPRVAEAIAAECGRLALYPNPTSAPLRAAIAAHHGLEASQVIVGNGSDDVLNLLVRAFVGDSASLAQTFPSYSLYPVLAAIQAGGVLSIDFDESMALPVEKLAKLDAPILFLTSPNAPTGVGFSLETLRTLLDAFAGIVVIDEAYVDFAEETAVALLGDYPRLVVTRTFSKSYGLAGLRVGYGLASAETIGLLDRVRDSYNVNRLSQAGALAALADQDYLRETVGRVKATRRRFAEALHARGWFVYPSQTNFVLARPTRGGCEPSPAVAEGLFQFLQEKRILVRYFPACPLTANALRITIGTDSQMDIFLEAIDQWQSNA